MEEVIALCFTFFDQLPSEVLLLIAHGLSTCGRLLQWRRKLGRDELLLLLDPESPFQAVSSEVFAHIELSDRNLGEAEGSIMLPTGEDTEYIVKALAKYGRFAKMVTITYIGARQEWELERIMEHLCRNCTSVRRFVIFVDVCKFAMDWEYVIAQVMGRLGGKLTQLEYRECGTSERVSTAPQLECATRCMEHIGANCTNLRKLMLYTRRLPLSTAELLWAQCD